MKHRASARHPIKSKFIMFFLLLVAGTVAFADADGYRNLQWGIDPGQLSRQYPGLMRIGTTGVYFPQPQEALGYLYPIEFNDPHRDSPVIRSTRIDAFVEDGPLINTTFFFSDQRLVAIQLRFAEGNPYSALVFRHGERATLPINLGTSFVKVAVWTDILNDRLIVYPAGPAASTGSMGSTVTYLCTSWLKSVSNLRNQPTSALLGWLE